MIKFLLISAPVSDEKSFSLPPMGGAYIASVLKKNNYPVSVLELYDLNEFQDKLQDYEYDVIGITGLATQYRYIREVIRKIKSLHPDKKIIVGGFIGSTIPELLLNKTDADVIVIGEGEVTIIELLKAIEDDKDLSNIDGLAFKRNNEIIVTKPRDLIADIDSIPFPAWDLFNLENYFSDSGERGMPILTSRGCPYNCIFCYDSFGKQMRYRSAQNVIDEIKYLKDAYNISRIFFYDETFTVHRQRTKELCSKIIVENLHIKWGCTGRVNCIDEELLKIMKEAGLDLILYGIESGSQKILDEMNKGVTIEQTRNAIKMTRRIGINMSTPLMLGSPGETEETIKESVSFFTQENIFSKPVFQTPYPGSKLWIYALETGLIKDEEEYIEKSGSFSELHVNLTGMSDEKLLELKQYAEKKIFWSFLRKNIPSIVSKIVEYGKTEGLKSVLAKINLIVQMVRRHAK